MLRLFSFLSPKVAQVKNETVEAANTALRVGQILEDIKDSALMEYDPAASYASGQLAVYQGTIMKAVGSVAPNQTPTSHASKWDRKLVLTTAQIATGNYNPVSAHVLAQLLAEGESTGGIVPMADEDTAGIARRATLEDVDEGVSDDSFITPFKIKSYLSNLFEAFVQPTIDSVLANGNISNRALRLGNISNLSPNFVNNIQAVKVAFQAVPNGEWFDVLISQNDFKAIVQRWLTLNDVLYNGNTTEGVGVFGGVGLFPRVEAPFSTEVAVYVPGPVINDKQVTFIEKQNSSEFIVLNAERMDEAQKARLRSALNAAPDVVGTVIGRHCITVDDAVEVGGQTQFPLTAIADGAAITHTLDLSNGFLQNLYDTNGRHYGNAYVTAPNATTFTFQHPGVSDAFTGTLVITPKA